MSKYKNHKYFYSLVALIGFILLLLEIEIYRKTIISIKILSLIVLIVAFISFFIIKKDHKKTYQNRSNFFPFIQSVISFGFIACYAFMALNFYFADARIETKSFSILKKHTIGTKESQPAVEINYNGIEKQLVFYSPQKAQMDTSTQVILKVQKGFLGFDIVSDMQLK